MGTILAVKNPKWVRGGAQIDLVLTHSILGDIPFTASPDDPEEYGRLLFAAASAGQFGEVQPEQE